MSSYLTPASTWTAVHTNCAPWARTNRSVRSVRSVTDRVCLSVFRSGAESVEPVPRSFEIIHVRRDLFCLQYSQRRWNMLVRAMHAISQDKQQNFKLKKSAHTLCLSILFLRSYSSVTRTAIFSWESLIFRVIPKVRTFRLSTHKHLMFKSHTGYCNWG